MPPKFFKKIRKKDKGIIEGTPLEKEYFENMKADPEKGMMNTINKYLKKKEGSHAEQEEGKKSLNNNNKEMSI